MGLIEQLCKDMIPCVPKDDSRSNCDDDITKIFKYFHCVISEFYYTLWLSLSIGVRIILFPYLNSKGSCFEY